jgi:small subunit ribosomal protein S20
LRTQIKKLRTALAAGDKAQSQELLNPTIALIDKSVNKGVLHKNTAARHKSRLTRHVSELN